MAHSVGAQRQLFPGDDDQVGLRLAGVGVVLGDEDVGETRKIEAGAVDRRPEGASCRSRWREPFGSLARGAHRTAPARRERPGSAPAGRSPETLPSGPSGAPLRDASPPPRPESTGTSRSPPFPISTSIRLDGHVVAQPLKRPAPGLDMRGIGVDQGAVDVEDHSAQGMVESSGEAGKRGSGAAGQREVGKDVSRSRQAAKGPKATSQAYAETPCSARLSRCPASPLPRFPAYFPQPDPIDPAALGPRVVDAECDDAAGLLGLERIP